ncbi:helix-turn-helix transcriptional regulator [Rudaeicoccus suwonensis]|uniref:Helix-turn-helix protein n=1 Tax=Rudaeicoccus suwonensis TaxID=657409 RepID=A0A561EAN8_9MICO|nr:helix-turn-helix transcriptional regulator [Rudaeicoccus suwonensis]TWE12680.1 helix-turn-helix protein [Rudaeicoccus suwonensis]
MDNRAEIRDFLSTRRAKITPDQVGLPSSGRRRVPGLRREEVAVLAGVSPEWYTRLEKGHITGVSDEVLHAVAAALRLNDIEREHLFNLARAAKPARTPGQRRKPHVSASMQRVLDSMTGAAAFVRTGRLDIVAANTLGAALYSPVLSNPHHRGNIARFNFLDPRAVDYYPDYGGALSVAVALLRTEAGRNPHDPALTELIGQLATQSEAFRTRWGTHDVRAHKGGIKTFNHPEVGYLELAYDSMELIAAPGLILTAYTAEPATPSADNLNLLASWAATDHPAVHSPTTKTRTRSVYLTAPDRRR